MHRLPLSNDLKFEFREPSHHPLFIGLSQYYTSRKLHKSLKILHCEIEGEQIIKDSLAQGDGILLTPNHSDHADSALMFELGRRISQPFYFMATHAIFQGINRFVLPRIGCFPVDREGTDKRALRKSIDILSASQSPLVIFPEGEIYRLNDTITPLREGVSSVAGMAARKVGDKRKIKIIPVGIKYRFPPDLDPLPWMHRTMAELERRFSWREASHMPIQERIYRYASGMLSLKEIEFFGNVQAGSVRERVTSLRNFVLGRVESALAIASPSINQQTIPERVKACRRRILETLESPNLPPDSAVHLRQFLDDLFLVIQLYSYPGDYVQNRPTFERAAEILIKFKQDALGRDLDYARHEMPRHARVFVGEPIDATRFLADSALKPDTPVTAPETGNPARTKTSRKGQGSLTDYLETKMQELLDKGSPGRPLPGCEHLV